MKIFDEKKTIEFAKNLRKNILKMSLSAGSASSHFGGALSCIDIVAVLFQNVINFNQNNYKELSRDRFVLSKGHACMSLYSVLKEIGIIFEEEMLRFEKSDSFLLGHPIKNLEKGIELSTGSLGIKKNKVDSKVYVIIGDGECNEGSIWEVALSAPKFNLNNLCVILDRNNFQQTGLGKDILDLNPLQDKWKSFNWDVLEIDGHNYTDIYNSLIKPSDKPKIIIANTIKGKGFSFSENDNSWHHRVLTNNQYQEALIELEK
jgi:transketolase